MKKHVIALSLGLLTIGTFAQKNELKTAEKAIKSQDYSAAISSITSVDGMANSMDAKYKAKYYFLKGQAYAGKKDYKVAAKAFNDLMTYEKENGKPKYTDKATPMLNNLITEVSNKAIALYNDDKDYKNASENFYLTYLLRPVDTSFLYNAAVSSTLAEDYDVALKHYRELKNIGYTGASIQYIATNKVTGLEENLGSKGQRDTMVKLGQYSNPREESSGSKKSTIVKNIGQILVSQGKVDEAIVAVKEAREMNPGDLNLLLTEADLYIKLDKMDKFGELMTEAIELDPNNPTLFYNLGVVNAGQGKTEEAKGYYKKAIELKPDYADAYMNLAVLILGEQKAIVEEMNKNLSNFDKYDELEAKQKDVYRKALPYLEKADELKRSTDTVRSLLNIYDVLEMEEKADKLRPIYKEMRQG
jgi:tetratricopeptide (TPR) repeat protein